MDKSNLPQWSYYNPVKVVAGTGIISNLKQFVPEGNVLFVSMPVFSQTGLTQRLSDDLGPERVTVNDKLKSNPEIDDIDRFVDNLDKKDFSSIVALGGGSVIDTAKALAVSLPSGLEKFLDKTLRHSVSVKELRQIQIISIPTTSGTGAEVTPFATIWDSVSQKKHSLTGVFSKLVLLDPELTLSLPVTETLYTSLDAVSHSLESLWNKNRTPVSEAFALNSLRLANEALPSLMKSSKSLENREKMQQSSLLGGLAISQSRTAIAHSMSYPLTLHFGVPHGLACSFSLISLLSMHLEDGFFRENPGLFQSTLNMLTSLDLIKEMDKYCSYQDILTVVGEMYNPGRADNYILPVSNKLITKIITRSYELK